VLVHDLVDGRKTARAHGRSHMPVWGNRYLSDAGEAYFDVPYEPEAFVGTRVLAVTEYVARLQAK
jgi:hypothetical protein